ncbi:uncharacterized protein LOC123543968 [Mercenaria mercenaria]|uniref:uncharacterized protein LOC123532108 n=1 Tax=Mercenaria mercenaria TaxID=6596 RepID=UPI001E1D8B33|nr:uncharacterized protein LOC123532108 [Mercenaria mercenaria]XP_045185963.1 uncharacterized protein LOC123543968 [Mercenaria mercenaria]
MFMEEFWILLSLIVTHGGSVSNQLTEKVHFWCVCVCEVNKEPNPQLSLRSGRLERSVRSRLQYTFSWILNEKLYKIMYMIKLILIELYSKCYFLNIQALRSFSLI